MYTYVLLYMCNMYIFIYKWEHLYVYIYMCVYTFILQKLPYKPPCDMFALQPCGPPA